MSWQRARQPEQKEERRKAILEAAATLFAARQYDAVSLGAIASEVGLAKSNLYRYFESKEAIFLTLFREDLDAYVVGLEARLAPHHGCDDPAVVARQLSLEAVSRPRFLRLQSRLAGVLEQHVSRVAIVEFKRDLDAVAERLVGALVAAMPSLGAERARQAVLLTHALTAGLWPMSNPGPELQAALQEPDLAHHRLDFELQLEAALSALLSGLIAEKPSAPTQ